MRVRSRVATTVVVAVTIAVAAAMPVQAQIKPKPGMACSSLGNHQQYGGKEYVCQRTGGRLAWAVFRPSNNSGGPSGSGSLNTSGLPQLSSFATSKTDVLPVDISRTSSVAPFLGARSSQPHQGMHFNWSNADGSWNSAGSAPENFPAVRAVADGVVTMIQPHREMGSHQAYGLGLIIANDGKKQAMANYSLEPFVMEPSPGFYAQFIKVKEGQRVRRGDVLAYMYVPPQANGSTHLHFHLNVGPRITSPSIFTPAAVAQMQARFGSPAGVENGQQLPACVGYRITADENPFGTGASDCL